jgi:hypothetical protein
MILYHFRQRATRSRSPRLNVIQEMALASVHQSENQDDPCWKWTGIAITEMMAKRYIKALLSIKGLTGVLW